LAVGSSVPTVKLMAQTETTTGRSQPAIVAIAPVVLLAGFLLHPYIGVGLPDQNAVASAAADHPTRWGVAHLATGVGSALLILAFLAIRDRLRETGPERWSALGVPFIVMGSALYTLLPGMEFAPLAAAEAGANVEAVGEALLPWFVPMHFIGAVAFGVGVLAFRRGIAESGIVSGGLFRLVECALAVMAVARFVPLSLIQFYVQGVAGVLALCPLAWVLWKAPVKRLGKEPQAVPAT
jgi:hypothetical protein